MSETQKKFYLTTPIYYVNARPHIGHAYSTIAADVIARRHRLLGDDTFFLTGTDEHGQKIQRAALAAGVPPQEYADQVSATFRDLWKRMGITNNDYIRTTDERHKRGVQKLWKTLEERGQIYLSSYTGQYSVGEEMFIDGPPGTIGPDGKPTETITEENYFFKLKDYQLAIINLIESEDPENRLHIQPETTKNEVLSFLRGNLVGVAGMMIVGDPGPLEQGLNFAEKNEGLLSGKLRRSQAGFLYAPGALKDLSISRTSFTWGIPVPEQTKPANQQQNSPETEGHGFSRANNSTAEGGSALPKAVLPDTASIPTEKHVIYVWLDALANYMTAVGYGSEDPTDIAKFAQYWPADLHLVGKEITRFHCIYWPAFLLALNPKQQHAPNEPNPILTVAECEEWAKIWLPKAIIANGWLLFEDSKMSKSRGNVVRTETILDAFGSLLPKPADLPSPELSDEAWKHQQDLFGADVLRYFLLREIPFGQDGSFSFDALWSRYNSDLVNGYGNLVSRTLSMIEQYFDHEIPTPADGIRTGVDYVFHSLFPSETGGASQGLRVDAIATASMFNTYFEETDFTTALFEVWMLVAKTDGFITKNAPWKLRKSEDEAAQQKVNSILYVAAESIRYITALIHPVLPYATAKVWQQLGLGDIEEAARKGELKDLQWGGLKPGTKLGTLSPIFPRADKGLIQIMTDAESSNAPQKTQAPNPSKLIDEKTSHTPIISEDPTHPGAPPRTSAMADPAAGTHVGASAAFTTERPGTPSHAEAPASGPFANAAAASSVPDTPQIAIDDFVKIDLRVAKIVVAERIPKADKLLRLEVDLGYEKRQILSGIAEWYTPEELLGRRIVVIANLAPRKMRGLESHGMLLAASEGDNGKPVLATFGEDIALGSRLR